MRRIKTTPRNNWQDSVEQLGFGFHTSSVPYWDESVYYEFTIREIDAIEKATAELWKMCLAAVQHVIDAKLYKQFHIPGWFVEHIETSWNDDHPSIYGRFDLAIRDGQIKLLEFNADTPTSLYEAAIVQWHWLQDFDKEKDQFNSLHERLVDGWKYLKPYLQPGKLHFSCVKQSLEDLTTVEYLRDCAIQAGVDTKLVYMEDLGWNQSTTEFVDMEDEPVKNIFKLYPYEWLVNEEFGRNIVADSNKAYWIEPSWKMIMSNKAILPILWKLYPNNPYLLKTYSEQGDLTSYARKPLLSREGANIRLVKEGDVLEESIGEYGEEGFIYQELFELPNMNGNYPVIGSWIIAQEPAGIGIRESTSPITNNLSRFVPHLIRG